LSGTPSIHCKEPWCAKYWGREREFFIDNLLVRIHFIIEMILEDWPCAMRNGNVNSLFQVASIGGCSGECLDVGLGASELERRAPASWRHRLAYAPVNRETSLIRNSTIRNSTLPVYRETSLIRNSTLYRPTVGLYLGSNGGPRRGGCFLLVRNPCSRTAWGVTVLRETSLIRKSPPPRGPSTSVSVYSGAPGCLDCALSRRSVHGFV